MADQPPQQPRDPSHPLSYGQPHPYGQPPSYGQPQYPRPLPDESTQPMFGNQPSPEYPRQELLPQDVQPAPSRLPLILTLVVVLLLVGGGIGAWLVLRDNGEANRADYCAALKKLVPDNNLIAAVVNGDASTADQIARLADLAPTVVHDDWQTLAGLLAPDADTSSSSPADMFAGLGALKSVVQDANDKCGLSVEIPRI